MAISIINQPINPYANNSLLPKEHTIKGTDPHSKIWFKNVTIFDSTGADTYRGDVLTTGERIVAVGKVDETDAAGARVIDGHGRFLMSGLCDAHTHFTWNNGGDLDALGSLPVEEHMLFTARAARTYLDSGYTMCLGAASAKERLDIAMRDAINAGDFPGPRYLANAMEIAVPEGELVASITAFASGPEEMAAQVEKHIKIGADQIKLSMSGEEICETRAAEDNFFSDEETAAAVKTAHAHGKRVCAHARSDSSVRMCLRHGVDIIYHASFVTEDTLAELVKAKDRVWVAPGVNWLVNTLTVAADYGYPPQKAEEVGYKKELQAAIKGMNRMRELGIRVLPGGDYGFAWTPHSTYARDLMHFVELFGYTPKETLIIATAGGGDLFMRPHELGKIQPGYYADMILVNGNPLDDIKVLQDHSKLDMILINGKVHKETARDMAPFPPVAGQDNNTHAIVPDL